MFHQRFILLSNFIVSKSQLLQAIQSSLMEVTNESLRMKIAEIAGELAGGVLEPSEWPSLHQLTADLCNVSHSNGYNTVCCVFLFFFMKLIEFTTC